MKTINITEGVLVSSLDYCLALNKNSRLKLKNTEHYLPLKV